MTDGGWYACPNSIIGTTFGVYTKSTYVNFVEVMAYSQDAIQILPASTGLNDDEKEALRHAISDKLMQDEGWSQDDHGRILNAKGRAIYKIGYVTAIRKLVE